MKTNTNTAATVEMLNGIPYDSTAAVDEPVNEALCDYIMYGMSINDLRAAIANENGEWILSILGQELIRTMHIENPTAKEIKVVTDAHELTGEELPNWAVAKEDGHVVLYATFTFGSGAYVGVNIHKGNTLIQDLKLRSENIDGYFDAATGKVMYI